MKTTLKLATILSLSISTSTLMAAENQAKKYPIETGKISYEIKGSGNVMGMLKTEIIGKKRVIFNNFGMNELTEKSKIKKTTHNGKTETKKYHTLKYAKGTITYSVDFDKKQIIRSENPMGAMGQLFGGRSMADSGEAMLKKMGGKKIGTDEVAGQKCDIWELMGSKQCIYKGIPLRIITDVMGMKNTEVATKVEFDIDVSKEDLKLPDFPVYDYNLDNMMKNGKPKPLDKSMLDELDAKAEKQAAKESADMQEAFKMMAEASKKAGIKEGEKATESQRKAMEQNMKNAVFPMMKKRILDQAAMMDFGKECFSAADTVEDANKCTKQAEEKFPSGDLKTFDEWNPEIKKELLIDMDKFLGSIDCIKAANDMGGLEKCMPREE